ncbi:Response regulator receiver sensor signal transduction histidine kinase [Candidatus Magnetomoraceae bacterium gMMP-15]
MEDSNKAVILIVDDEPLNIDVLRESLKDEYKLIIATRGAQALKLAEKKQPDLILLDIMMPEMDGYETCERLKENENTKHIPIIFITALNETEDKTEGYDLGAVDYITKPFEIIEILVRIRTHLTISIYERQLKAYKNMLNQTDSFSNDMVSKINEHSSIISGNIQIIKLFWTLAGPIVLNHADEDKTGRVRDIVGQFENMLDGIIENSRGISYILNKIPKKQA